MSQKQVIQKMRLDNEELQNNVLNAYGTLPEGSPLNQSLMKSEGNLTHGIDRDNLSITKDGETVENAGNMIDRHGNIV